MSAVLMSEPFYGIHMTACVMHPGLERYGWVRHDGETFGRQEVVDGGVTLTTSLVRACRVAAIKDDCNRQTTNLCPLVTIVGKGLSQVHMGML